MGSQEEIPWLSGKWSMNSFNFPLCFGHKSRKTKTYLLKSFFLPEINNNIKELAKKRIIDETK